MPKIDRATVEQFVAKIRSRDLDGDVIEPVLEAQTQHGPNCGFYALSVIMDYWHRRNAANPAMPARKRDLGLPPGQAKAEGKASLRSIGKQGGALDLDDRPKLSTGGVFTAEQLAEVARATRKYEARVVTQSKPEDFIVEICRTIMRGIPALVAFDVVKGEPQADQKGQHSHWGVVFGFFEEQGVRQFLATHGHGGYYQWSAHELQQSNFALSGTRRELPEEAKVRLLGFEKDGSVDRQLALNRAQWHWRKSEEVATYAKIKPDHVTIEYKPGVARRPAATVAQNLAHHIICVYPPGFA